jgi:YggT family protein
MSVAWRVFSREIVVRLRQLVRLVLLIVEAIIAVRILFKVAGANPGAGFASFVYKVSGPFVNPFHPVFADGTVNGHPFEVGSVLAMAVYAALAYLVVRVARLIFTPGH